MWRWKTNAMSTTGSAAMTPPVASRPKSTPWRPMKSLSAIGSVFDALVWVMISAYRNSSQAIRKASSAVETRPGTRHGHDDPHEDAEAGAAVDPRRVVEVRTEIVSM